MKPVLKTASILMITILPVITGCSAPKDLVTVHSTLCEPIGLSGKQLDLCVENRDGTPEHSQSSVYYLKTATGTQPLALSGLSTYSLLVSPDRNYVVIEENAGEGHLVFSIANLDDIRAKKDKPAICRGWDDLVGYDELEWRGEQLYFSATQNLRAKGSPATEDKIIYRYRLAPADNCSLQLVAAINVKFPAVLSD